MRLYEINYEIENCIDFETGEVDIERLTELEMEKKKKIHNIGLLIKNLDADAEAYKKEKLEFAKRQKAAENKVESLKKYLSDCLAGEKYEDEKLKINFRKSKALELSTEFHDERFISYVEKIDNAGIKEALKKGENIPGAVIVERSNIQIK